jgi:hypothetical protein
MTTFNVTASGWKSAPNQTLKIVEVNSTHTCDRPLALGTVCPLQQRCARNTGKDFVLMQRSATESTALAAHLKIRDVHHVAART